MWRASLCLLLSLLLATSARAAEAPQIGAEDDWYPYSGLRDGRLGGMAVDIVRAAFEASGTEVGLASYPYSRCMHLAQNGVLAGCFNTTPTAQTRRLYRLSTEPLFTDDILIWSRREQSKPLSGLDDLQGKRVAVTLGYEYGPAFDGYTGLVRIAVRQDLFGFRMLERGRVDHVIAFRGTSEQLFRDKPELANLFTPVYLAHRAELHLSFSRRHPQAEQLLARFDEGMRQIRRNGRYDEIIWLWRHPATAAASH